MTLIVGYANEKIGFLVGDTLLPPLLEVKGNPVGPVNGEFHGLKIQIIDGNTAIAFASSNAADAALDLVVEIAEELRTDPQLDVVAKLAELYTARVTAETGDVPNCEFLVLKIEGDRKRLAHITNAGAKYVQRAYIGDQDKYNKMLQLKKPYISPTHQIVVHPDGSTTVSPIEDDEGLTEFMETGLALQALVEQRRGIGIYYIAGKLGFVMIAGDPETCRKLPAESLDNFKQLAKDQFDLDLC
jgi:hypothetical protein